MKEPIIVWLRRDFRLHDHPALHEAASAGRPIIPVYIHAPEEQAPWQPGAAANWWRHRTMEHFAQTLKTHRSRLIIRRGPSLDTLKKLIQETGATSVYWNRLYEPTTIPRDTKIKEALKTSGIEVKSFGSALLFEPSRTAKEDGTSYLVFTPFWKNLQQLDETDHPLPVPTMHIPEAWPESLELKDLDLLPKIAWHSGLEDTWTPGEVGGMDGLESFLQSPATDYKKSRDFPAQIGTSRMSPYLHHGDISPRTIWHRVKKEIRGGDLSAAEGLGYLRQLAWREFSYHLLYHHPRTAQEPLRKEFAKFPWQDDNAELLDAWKRGETGYELVDAGMRELWHTGWMHNRVRMVAASFLVKHLRIHWLEGARWFWDTLVDADLANNTMGWQWTAGSGADASPYFRVFNPMIQADKFDRTREYRGHWLEREIKMAKKSFHGGTSLEPIVNHAKARDEALAAYDSIKRKK